MSNYQEMTNAAETARRNYLRYQERAWGYFGHITTGLISHCGVPQEHIVYLKWNAIRGRFTTPDDGSEYTLPGAVTYDEQDNSFNLGVFIYLTPAHIVTRQFVRFALWVSEKDGAPSVRVGLEGKPKSVQLNDTVERNAFCEEIAQQVIQAFSTSTREGRQKPIGFEIG